MPPAPKWYDTPELLAELKVLCAKARLHPLLSRRVDAEELYGMVYLKLAGIDPPEPHVNPLAYLRVAFENERQNLLRFHLTAQQRDPRREQHDAHAPPAESAFDLVGAISAGGTSPSSAADRNERERLIRQVIHTHLSENQRRALELHFQGFTRTEIAAQMGESRKNVNQMLSRANEKLEEHLGPYFGGGQS